MKSLFSSHPSAAICHFASTGFARPLLLLILSGTATYGLAQEPKNQWSFQQVQAISRVPVLQDVLVDSIDKKLAFLAGDTALAGKAINLIQQGFRSELQSLQNGAASPLGLINRLPLLYAQKTTGLPTLKGGASIQVDDLTLEMLYLPGGRLSTGSFGLHASVGGVPFTQQVVFAEPSTVRQAVTFHGKMDFDREAFLAGLRSQLAGAYNLEKVLLQDLDFRQIMRQYATRKLEGIKSSLAASAQLKNAFSSLSVDEFLLLTKEQLIEKLAGSYHLDSLQTVRKGLVQQLADRGHSLELQSGLEAIDSTLAGFNQLESSLLKAKAVFEEGEINYSQLLRYQQLVNTNAQALVASPDFIRESAGQLFAAKGLSRLFMHLQSFTAGQFSSNWDGLSVANVMTTGVGANFLKKQKLFGVQLSRIENLGWLKDNAFSGNLFEPRQLMQAVRLGKGDDEKRHSHLSLINANTLPNSRDLYTVLPRNTFVASLSKRLTLPSWGTLEAGLSKSATQPKNTFNGDHYASGVALQHLGDDFFQTLAVDMAYEGDFSAVGLRPKAFLRYSGMGYQNPASTLGTRGSLSFGGGGQQSLFKKRLVVISQFSRRITRTSPVEENRYLQNQHTVSLRYKAGRKVRLGAGWNFSSLTRKEQHSFYRLYHSSRLSADVTVTTNWKRVPVFQFLSLGYQSLQVPGARNQGHGRLLWLSASNSLSFPKGTLTTMFQYQDQQESASLFGDLFSSEASWSYRIGSTLQLSSGLTYLNQEGLARQAGFRQTAAASLGKRFDLSLVSDLRHNIGHYAPNFFYPTSRGECQLIYHFN